MSAAPAAPSIEQVLDGITALPAMRCQIRRRNSNPCRYDARWHLRVTCTQCGADIKVFTCRSDRARLQAGVIGCATCHIPMNVQVL